jgi:hypothetical protein
LTDTRGVDIIDTSVLTDLPGNLGSDDTSTSGGRDHSNDGGTSLSLDLARNGMDTSDLGTPITSSDGDELHLGIKKSTLDGDLNFFTDFDTNADVAHSITASNDSLESGSLTGLGLLLDGKDAHDLVREFSLGVLDELISDLMFLDGDGVGIDLLEGSDRARFNESTELGKGVPDLFTAATEASGSSATSTAASSISASTTSASTGTESSSSTFLSSWSSLGLSFHFLLVGFF